jgi:hypothetical protein
VRAERRTDARTGRQTGRQTDRRVETNGRFLQFCESPKKKKNCSFVYGLLREGLLSRACWMFHEHLHVFAFLS